jgi:hypothetical protein
MPSDKNDDYLKHFPRNKEATPADSRNSVYVQTRIQKIEKRI